MIRTRGYENRMRAVWALVAVCLLALCAAGPTRATAVSYEDVVKTYQYDHAKPLNIKIRETKDFPSFSKIYLSYDSLNGGRVPAVLIMPKPRVKPMNADRSTVQGTFPVIFFMHFHVSDKTMLDIFQNWAGYGVALFAIDGVYRGEREEKGQDILMADPIVSASHIRMQIFDIMRGFDLLAQWKGLDPGRIGFFGVSMGSITGTAATALDSRIKTAVYADGAANFPEIFNISDYKQVAEMHDFIKEHNLSPAKVKEAFDFVDPLTFAPHLDPRPVCLINGKKDTTFPPKVVELYYNSVNSKTKKIIWYDSTHILPADKLYVDTLKWMRKYL
jgi:uncharacterized protein